MGIFSKSISHSDCNLSSYNLANVSHIAKPLHQHQGDVVFSTYKQKIQFEILLLLTPFCLLGHIYIHETYHIRKFVSYPQKLPNMYIGMYYTYLYSQTNILDIPSSVVLVPFLRCCFSKLKFPNFNDV